MSSDENYLAGLRELSNALESAIGRAEYELDAGLNLADRCAKFMCDYSTDLSPMRPNQISAVQVFLLLNRELAQARQLRALRGSLGAGHNRFNYHFDELQRKLAEELRHARTQEEK
ncbi:MAG: hypothetical protein LBV21_01820, partial [Candidatus Adiutrix sp.]|nr:hypothetical protein [Candidatus Adiutrix sp.]